MDDRSELLIGESERPAVGDGVHAPLVLGTVARTSAVDDELPVARVEQPVAEDAGAERPHPRGEILMDVERAEQRERLDIGAPPIHRLSARSISGV